MDLKKKLTQHFILSMLGLVQKELTFESYENMAMNAAILYLAVCVCNIMNKVKMCDGSVH